MPKEIVAYGFRGMNNQPQPPGPLVDREERRITPEIVVNADVTDTGAVLKRQGYLRQVALGQPHSLWSDGNVMLCVAAGVQYPTSLWRIEGVSAQELCAVEGPRARVTFVEVNNLVYAGNPYWKAVYDLSVGQVRNWGVTLPTAPSVSMVDGDLPPGVYLLAYTQVAGGQLSGNGPLLELRIEGMARGIQLNNLPAGGQAWITHGGGGKLFLARLSGNRITRQAPEVQVLPTFEVQPPPGFVHFQSAFGRIWGVNGKKLLYSEPNFYERFRAGNFLPFLEDLVMVAPVEDGLFVNSRTGTWFLRGTEPKEMASKRVGNGAVPGTLTYAQVEGGGYEISRKLSQLPSPVWMTSKGFVVGTNNGHLVHLTEARLKIVGRTQGASLSFSRDGIPRVLSSIWGPPTTEEDGTLRFIFNNNRLYVPQPIRVEGSGGVIIG
jgi:hypothetical protein